MSLSFTAQIVKISKAFLSDIENGKRIPQSYTLKQILKVLDAPFYKDMSIKQFLEGKLHEAYTYYVDIEDAKEIQLYHEEWFFKEEYEFSLGFLQFYLQCLWNMK